ncbi:MAG: hypothetical protein KC635_19740 [Myxococcales bacterium]|nr:hypothetical protein [Myxococcales bacterium]
MIDLLEPSSPARAAAVAPLALPTVDAVGVVRYPDGWRASPRPASPLRRAFATALLALFAGATIVGTVVSLGRYCVTTDGANASALPRAASSAPTPAP